MRTTAKNITERHLEAIVDRVATANKTAKKLGAGHLKLSVSPAHTQHSVYADGQVTWVDGGGSRVRSVYDVELAAPDVMVPGWELLARLDVVYDGDGNSAATVSHFPGVEEDLGAVDISVGCEHCGVLRRRKVLYLLQKGSIRMLVGGDCLMWYTQANARVLRHLTDLGGVLGEPGEGRTDTLDDLLPWVAQAVRHRGWIPRSAQDGRATVDVAVDMRSRPYVSNGKTIVAEWGDPSLEDVELADRAVAWAQALEGEGDYERNLVVLAMAGYFVPRLVGLAGSIVGSYVRHLSQVAGAGADGGWTGEVGQRRQFSGTLERTPRGFPGDWGTRWMIVVREADTGALLVSWASDGVRDKLGEVEVGVALTFRARVKKHETYRGKKQTILERITWNS